MPDTHDTGTPTTDVTSTPTPDNPSTAANPSAVDAPTATVDPADTAPLAGDPTGADTPAAPAQRRRARTSTSATLLSPRRRGARSVDTASRGAGRTAAGGRASDTPHDRVWAALRARSDVTAIGLSTDSGVGRSTVAKLLAAWAEDGSATSAPGNPGATGRAARRWSAAPSDLPPAAGPTHDPGDAHDSGDAGKGTRTRRSGTRSGAGRASKTERRAADIPAAGKPPAPRPRAGSLPNGAGRNRSGIPRLAAGALQGMVADHLTEHPGEHGPTGIGRALGRSSGAVANALERLVTTGWALRTNDRPRRYRAAEPAETAAPIGLAANASTAADDTDPGMKGSTAPA